MPGAGAELRVLGVTGIDQDEIAELFPGKVRFEQGFAQGGEYGELLTAAAVVVLSVNAIRLLAVWIAKSRRSAVIEQEFEVQDVAGNRWRRSLRVTLKETDQPEEKVLAALRELLSADVGLKDLEGGSGK
jgi:hypothetical protein